jgi:two-component system, cell cycle sensor histidine kinase and response regulator CckA
MPGIGKDMTVRSCKETILVVEDDDMLREGIKGILEEFGYSIIEAVDGTQGIREFTKNKDRIHLVLMDVVMPRKGGRDLYREIRTLMPHAKVIISSGYTGDLFFRDEVIENDCQFIKKPYSPCDLVKKIQEMLKK